jgi:hypothetical protein
MWDLLLKTKHIIQIEIYKCSKWICSLKSEMENPLVIQIFTNWYIWLVHIMYFQIQNQKTLCLTLLSIHPNWIPIEYKTITGFVENTDTKLVLTLNELKVCQCFDALDLMNLCLVHNRLFTNIPVLYSLDDSSSTQTVTTKNIFQHCQITPEGFCPRQRENHWSKRMTSQATNCNLKFDENYDWGLNRVLCKHLLQCGE